MVKKKQQQQQQTKSSASLSVEVDNKKAKNVSMVTLVEMEGSPNSNRAAAAATTEQQDKNEGTPPPSRSPSPPPEVKQEDNQSAWSIEIEELTSEPRPGNRPTRSKKKTTSQQGTKNRSSSWAHTLRNSFKRKKNKTIAAAADEQSTNNGLNANPPQDSDEANAAGEVEDEDNTENKETESLPLRSRSPSPGPEQDEQSNWSIEIEEIKDERKSTHRSRKKTKPKQQSVSVSRSASWSRTLRNSFKRKKNKTVASDDLYNPEQIPDDFAIEADSSTATNSRQPPPRRSLSFQSFRQRKSVSAAAAAEPENGEKVVTGKIKAIKPEEKNKERTSAMVISKSSSNVGDVESLPADAKSNRANVFSSFFRKKTSIDTPTPEDVSSKGVKMRSSFSILNRRKSTDESTPTIKIEQDGGSKKTRRSVSMMFGSSFSLKRMFHQHDTPVQEVEEEQRTPPTSILVKRSPHPSPGRPKSVQIDESPSVGTTRATQQRKNDNKHKPTENVEDKETAPEEQNNKQKTETKEPLQPEATVKTATESTPPVVAPVADAQHGETSSCEPEHSVAVTVAATSSVDPESKMPEKSAAPVDSEVSCTLSSPSTETTPTTSITTTT